MVEYNESMSREVEILDHIRLKPTMYGVNTSSISGHALMFKEIVDNAIDEIRASEKHHTVNITIIDLKSTYQMIVTDQGRGVPLGSVKASFSKYGTSAKWGTAYNSALGTFGVGAKVVSALSATFCGLSKREEGCAAVTLAKGSVVYNKIDVGGDCPQAGTSVIYEPDSSLMDMCNTMFNNDGIITTIESLLRFNTAFLPNVTFNIYVGKARITSEQLELPPNEIHKLLTTVDAELLMEISSGGTPIDYMIDAYNLDSDIIHKSKHIHTIDSKGNDDQLGYDIDFFITSDYTKRVSGQCLAAVNMTRINAKTAVHVKGFDQAIREILRPFVDDAGMRTFFLGDYNLPIHSIIMATYNNADYDNQDKSNFTDEVFYRRYYTLLINQFKRMSADYWAELYSVVEKDLATKYHNFEHRDIKVGAGLKNVAFDLKNVSTYDGCRSMNNSKTELFITEGMSAGNYVKQMRDSEFQAVFKLTGKPINAIKMDSQSLYANAVYKDLKRILGTDPTDTKLERLNFSKIAQLSDADDDGAHITNLTMSILHRINPAILTSGRFVLANPPLYTLQTKSRKLFIRDVKALTDARVTTYSGILDINLRVGNGNTHLLTGPSFRDMCYLVLRVGKIITDVAGKLNIDPEVLELLVHCVDYLHPDNVDTNAIARILNIDRCIYETNGNYIILSVGLIEVIVPLDMLQEEILAYIVPELKLMHWNTIEFVVTTKYSDIYKDTSLTVMELYNCFKTLDKMYVVSRFKGLGGMHPEDLATTCLNPATRSFTVISSIGDIERIYRLLGADTNDRKRLVRGKMRTRLV